MADNSLRVTSFNPLGAIATEVSRDETAICVRLQATEMHRGANFSVNVREEQILARNEKEDGSGELEARLPKDVLYKAMLMIDVFGRGAWDVEAWKRSE